MVAESNMTYEERERLEREAAIQRNLQGVDDRQKLGEKSGESPIECEMVWAWIPKDRPEKSE